MNLPEIIPFAIGVSTNFWIALLSGLAPNNESYPSLANQFLASFVKCS